MGTQATICNKVPLPVRKSQTQGDLNFLVEKQQNNGKC